MSTENLGLTLDAKVAAFVAGMKEAAHAAEGLRAIVAAVQTAVAQSIAGLDLAGKHLGTSLAGSLKGIAQPAAAAAAQVRAAATDIEKSFQEAVHQAQSSVAQLAASTGAANKAIGAVGKVGGGGGSPVLGAMGAEVKTLEATIGGAASRIGASALTIRNALLGIAGGAVIKQIVGFSAQFEEQLANVNTVLTSADVPIARYKEQILALSQTTSKGLVDLTQGLYDAISAGVPATEGAGGAMEVLNAAQKAAVAGLGTTKDSVDALTTVMNAYQGKAGTASEISDKFFRTIFRGKIIFPELAHQIGDVATNAATFGVKLDELLGAIATTTSFGVNAAESVTSINQAITHIVKPSEDAAKAFADLGIEVGAAGLANKGFLGIFQEIAEKTKGNKQALTTLFPEIRALRAATILAGGGLQKFAQFSDEVAHSAGDTDTAFAKLSDTFAFAAGVAKNKLGAVMVDIADKILPRIQAAMGQVVDYLIAHKDSIASGFDSVLGALLGIGKFVADHGAGLLTFFATFFAVKAIASATTALAAFAGGLRDTVAAAASGAAAGTGFAGGFSGPIGKLGGVLSSVLRSPATLGLVVAAGIELGQALGEAIGNFFADAYIKEAAAIERSTEALGKRLTDKLAKLGFKSLEEQDKKRADFLAGGLVSGAGGKFQANALLDPTAAVKSLGPVDALNAAIETRNQLENEANKLVAQQAKLRGILADQEQKQIALSNVGAAALAEQLAHQAAATRGQLGTLAEQEKGIRAGGAAVVDATHEAIQVADEERAAHEAAQKAQRSLGKERETSAQRILAVEKEIAAEGLGAEKQRVANLAAGAKYDQAIADERLAGALEQARVFGASEEDLLALRKKAFDEGQALVDQEVAAAREAAGQEIQALRDVAAAREATFRDSADARAAIEKKAAEDVAAIQLKVDADVHRVMAERTKAQAELVQQQLDIVLKRGADDFNAQADAGKGNPAPGPGPTLVDQTKQAVKVLEDPLSELAEKGGLVVGTLAGVVLAVKNLGAVLSGIGGFLRHGIDDFIKGIAVGVEDLLGGLITGLPDQIDTIMSKTIPAIVLNLVSNLPAIIAGLIALGPRLIYALIAGIPKIIAAFAEGLARAALSVGGGIVKAIALGAKIAFSDGVKALVRLFAELPGRIAAAVGGAVKAAAKATGSFITAPFKVIYSAGKTVAHYLNPANWHSGGSIRAGQSDRFGAAALALAGAPQFAAGGLVPSLEMSMQRRLSRAMSRDDVPAILQAGEGVLSRRGMNALGGDAQLARLNRGQTAGGAPVAVTLDVRRGAEQSIVDLVLARIAVDVRSPAGVVRRAMDRSASGPPLMTRFVRGRT